MEHSFYNRFLRLEFSDKNITGSHQGAVKARIDIPYETGRRLCPVVGRVVKHADFKSDRLFDLPASDTLDADFSPFDIGYLLHAGALASAHRAPPNYGGYVNSLTEKQLEKGHRFNAAIEYDDISDIVWIVQMEPIQKDDEILVDYGDTFKLP